MAAGTSTGICIATEKTFIVVIESPVWRKHHTSQVQFQKHPLSTGISRSDFFYVEACSVLELLILAMRRALFLY